MNLGHLAAQINSLAARYHPLTPTSVNGLEYNPIYGVNLEDGGAEDLRYEIKERDGEIKDREKEIETLEKQVTELEEQLDKANEELVSIKVGGDSARELLDRVEKAESDVEKAHEHMREWRKEVEAKQQELDLMRKRKGRISSILKHGDAVAKLIFRIAEGNNSPETVEVAKKLAEILKTA